MKKLLIPALAVAVASAALPAAAQSYNGAYDRHGPSRGHGYEQNDYGWNAIAQRKQESPGLEFNRFSGMQRSQRREQQGGE